MSLDNLRHTFDRLVEKHTPAPQPQDTLTFDLDLFTAEERALFEPLHHKATSRPAREALTDLTDEELDQLQEWSDLHDVLAAGDADAATLARRHMAMTREELIEAFLALDLQRLLENTHIADEHVRYYLRPELYRNIVENYINRNRITYSTVEDMRKWIDFYDQLLPH